MVLKHLILMRHAHFAPSSTLSDHQSPLNARGRQAAKDLGGILRAKEIVPQMLWSSDSVRTRQTAELMFGDEMPENTCFREDLYLARAQKILYLWESIPEPDCESFMLLGHNPGMEYLMAHFRSGAQNQDGGTAPSNTLIRNVAMGSGAVFTRVDDKTNWLEPKAWRLTDFISTYDG